VIHNKEFYQKAFQKYGVSAQGVHWQDEQTQYKRFEVIANVIPELSNASIVDAGCGFGEFYNYLQKNDRNVKQYIGYDREIHMVDIAKKRFDSIAFEKKNILYDDLEEADYYICSGAMNIMKYEQVKLFIEQCFGHCKKAFVFNFLKYLTFNNISQDELLDICYNYTTEVEVIEGYLQNDFTLVMVKSNQLI
jgi:SAM-dependent methyltransferase